MGARTEAKEAAAFSTKKTQAIAVTMVKFSEEEKSPASFDESRDPTELFGLGGGKGRGEFEQSIEADGFLYHNAHAEAERLRDSAFIFS